MAKSSKAGTTVTRGAPLYLDGNDDQPEMTVTRSMKKPKRPLYRTADTSHTLLGDPIPAVATVADVMGRARRILGFAQGPRLSEHGEAVGSSTDYDRACARIVRHAPALLEAKAGSDRALVAAYLLGIAEGHFQAQRFITAWKEATTAEQMAAPDAEAKRSEVRAAALAAKEGGKRKRLKIEPAEVAELVEQLARKSPHRKASAIHEDVAAELSKLLTNREGNPETVSSRTVRRRLKEAGK